MWLVFVPEVNGSLHACTRDVRSSSADSNLSNFTVASFVPGKSSSRTPASPTQSRASSTCKYAAQLDNEAKT